VLPQRERRCYHRGRGGVTTEGEEVLSQRERRCYHRVRGGVITEREEVFSQRERRELNGRSESVGANAIRPYGLMRDRKRLS
jgi:hypothetical protein